MHANLAAELRRRGHKVTVVSDGGLHMQTESDIFVRREPGILESFRYLYRLFQIQPGLKGFDVVQLVNPGFFGLRPGKLSYFLKHLKNDNGSLFLTLAGNDFFFVEACVRKDMFRFSEFRIGKEKTRQVMCDPECEYGWFNSALTDYTRYLYSQLDGAVSLLPEYDMAARPVLGERLAFAGLPIDFSVLPDLDTEVEGKVRIFVGMVKGREIEKGTDRAVAHCGGYAEGDAGKVRGSQGVQPAFARLPQGNGRVAHSARSAVQLFSRDERPSGGGLGACVCHRSPA